MRRDLDRHRVGPSMGDAEFLGLSARILETFGEARRREGDSAAVNIALGEVHLLRQEYGPAVDCFTRALATDPRSVRAYLARATARIEAILRDAPPAPPGADPEPPGSADEREVIAADLNAAAQHGSDAGTKTLVHGLLCLLQGNYQGAAVHLREEANRTVSEPELWHLIALCALRCGENLMAEEAFGKLQNLRPWDGGAWSYRGMARFYLGRLDGAREDFDEAVRKSPERPEVHFFRSWFRIQSGSFPEAHADIAEAIRLDPDAHEYPAMQAELYCLEERWPLAIEAARRTTELAPDFWKVHQLMALVYRRAGEPAKALEPLSRALALCPARSELHSLRGDLHLRLDLLDEALEDFDRCVDLDPRNPLHYLHRGFIHERRRDSASAAADWTVALSIAPNDWEHRVQVKQLLAQSGPPESKP